MRWLALLEPARSGQEDRERCGFSKGLAEEPGVPIRSPRARPQLSRLCTVQGEDLGPRLTPGRQPPPVLLPCRHFLTCFEKHRRQASTPIGARQPPGPSPGLLRQSQHGPCLSPRWTAPGQHPGLVLQSTQSPEEGSAWQEGTASCHRVHRTRLRACRSADPTEPLRPTRLWEQHRAGRWRRRKGGRGLGGEPLAAHPPSCQSPPTVTPSEPQCPCPLTRPGSPVHWGWSGHEVGTLLLLSLSAGLSITGDTLPTAPLPAPAPPLASPPLPPSASSLCPIPTRAPRCAAQLWAHLSHGNWDPDGRRSPGHIPPPSLTAPQWRGQCAQDRCTDRPALSPRGIHSRVLTRGGGAVSF